MSLGYQTDQISLTPFKKELSRYSWSAFRQDCQAGFAIAFLTLPQAMAYALLAGLPIWCGLFASIYSSTIVALFGSSRHLLTGPSTAIAILIQSGISEILFTFYRDVTGAERDLAILQILAQLTFLVGAFQMLAAGFKLGRLTQFVSHSVVLGYLAGTAVAMVINQLFPFIGMPRTAGMSSFFERGLYLATHFYELHWPTALVGAGTLALLLLIKRLDKRLPAAVIALSLAALSAYLIQTFTQENSWYRLTLVADRGMLSELVPTITFPSFDVQILNALLPVSFAIALLCILEAASVAKSIAAASGQRLSINQEIFGLSLGNLFSSLMGALPVSGNSSRSMSNFNLGAQTRLSCVFNAAFALLILFLLEFLVVNIPLSAMAALLLMTSANIVNRGQLMLCLKATGSDALVFWMTFLGCIFFSLDIAFYIGVVLSITLYLKKAAVPRLVECEIDDDGMLQNVDFPKLHEKKKIRIIKVEGELFFGAADLFQTSLKAIMEGDLAARVILLQLKNARDIDATSCLALQQLHDYLQRSGRHLVACGLTWHIWEVLSYSGVVEMLGKENLFIFDERKPNLHMQKAVQRAKILADVPSVSEESKVFQAKETLGIPVSMHNSKEAITGLNS